MNNYFYKITLVLILFSMVACQSDPPTPMDMAEASLIPKPSSLSATGSSFAMTETTSIYFTEGQKESERLAQLLADKLRTATGFKLEVKSTSNAPLSGHIYLNVSDESSSNGKEGYELQVTEDGIALNASEPAGLLYGIQTIMQLLPAKIESPVKQDGPWEIATGTISDYPEYAYRGAMLDVARHFFPPKDVKKYIDYIASYKMNYLHLHLSDDQGWRIEIKSWPNLTTHGGSTEVGGGKGGFFTQEEYKDIVQYASDRFVTIVPEIDMPGHTNAALSSYPELNCDGKAPELYTGTEVGFSTLCTDKEIVYQFIDDVIKELAVMTPGPYIHIGGDESHVTPLKDYIPFINRVQDIVIKHGKKVIGWDEIALATLKPNSVVQYWAEAENALKGVEQGAKVLMSPAHKAYLDMQYDSTSYIGLHWAAYIEVDDGYNWSPEKLVEKIGKENIIGIEGALWTETVTNMEELEYLVFPRLLGLAEIGWTSPANRNWEEYKNRLAKQQERLDMLKINYFKSKRVPWKPLKI